MGNFLFIVLIIGLMSWGYFFNFDNPLDYYGDDPKINIRSGGLYGIPYYEKLPITFSIINCDNNRIDRITDAINIIEESTDYILKFEEVIDNSGIIEIYCSDSFESEYASGFGGIEFYEYGSISSGEVELLKHDSYNFERCNHYPSLEIHEILHALGIDHIYDTNSIMHPGGTYNACSYIDDSISGCLKNIYSNGENGGSCNDIPFIK